MNDCFRDTNMRVCVCVCELCGNTELGKMNKGTQQSPNRITQRNPKDQELWAKSEKGGHKLICIQWIIICKSKNGYTVTQHYNFFSFRIIFAVSNETLCSEEKFSTGQFIEWKKNCVVSYRIVSYSLYYVYIGY